MNISDEVLLKLIESNNKVSGETAKLTGTVNTYIKGNEKRWDRQTARNDKQDNTNRYIWIGYGILIAINLFSGVLSIVEKLK